MWAKHDCLRRVSNPSQATAPSPPPSKDFEIRLADVQPSTMQRVTVINGQMTQQTDYTYQFTVKPLHPGRLTLGRFSLRDRGRNYTTQPIQVTVKTESAGPEVFCEITSKRDVAFVGQPVQLTLEIWIRRFQQPGVGMLEPSNMWNLKVILSCLWGVFSQTDLNRPKYAAMQHEVENGRTDDFYVYYLDTTAYPTKAGPFDFGNIEFVYNYPVRIGRNIFSLTLERSRRLSARPKLPKLMIKPIPQEGRPADYNGAIGVYSITASAKPMSVPVGDPITLSLTIHGDGALDRLGPPRLVQVQGLTRDFEVSADVPAGDVEGNRKRFALTIRALREDVRQIPPIPFSFFNPKTEKFETSYSKAIPLKVSPAQRIALSDLPPAESGASEHGVLAPLVESSEGLFLNETNPDALLVDQSAALRTGAWAILAMMPIAYAATSIACARSARFRRDHAFRRRSHALSTARKALAAAGAESPAGLRAAFVTYIADRCNVPAGGLTRADAVKLLSDRVVSPENIQAADVLLEQLELAEYAGGTTHADLEGADGIWRLVQALEREKIR
jgi:hypothetical protein